ncbi:MAG: hypothetical protein RR336_11625, partial [Oscillospiraceae bacterium]
MKKRLLSILLTLCMALTLLPTAALAAEDTTETANSTISVETGGTTKYYDKQEEGWNAAAVATEAVTVKLLANWTAASTSDALVTSFGTGAGFGGQGYIFVPANKTIILDLNGHTLDRGLGSCTEAVSEGKVISVNGTLTLKDSSSQKAGTITGAYNLGGSAVDVQPSG